MPSGQREAVRPRRPDGPWVSISAAAKALGVSTSTLRVWASEGRVPHVRTAGGHRRFNPDGLRDWLARQPGQLQTAQRPRRASVRLDPAPGIAQAIRGATETVIATIDRYLEGQPLAEFRRLADNEQRATVIAWLETLADAFAAGTLAVAQEEAGRYGRMHGIAGSSAEIALAGSLALERALDAALAEASFPAADRRRVGAAMSSLTLRVAQSWAEAAGGAGSAEA